MHIEAKVTRAFNSSMEVHMKVWVKMPSSNTNIKSNEAYYTFVSLDPNGKPRPVNKVIPETEEENKLFDGALRRRQLRLILGGKMKPEEAEELKALFVKRSYQPGFVFYRHMYSETGCLFTFFPVRHERRVIPIH